MEIRLWPDPDASIGACMELAPEHPNVCCEASKIVRRYADAPQAAQKFFLQDSLNVLR
jgi:hypothetical protein